MQGKGEKERERNDISMYLYNNTDNTGQDKRILM